MTSRAVITKALIAFGFIVAFNNFIIHFTLLGNDISTTGSTDDIEGTLEIHSEDSLNTANKGRSPGTVTDANTKIERDEKITRKEVPPSETNQYKELDHNDGSSAVTTTTAGNESDTIYESNENANNENETAKGIAKTQIDVAVSEVQSDTNEDVNEGSVADSTTKPKLFLHVGPRKTATTTLQITVLRSPDYVAPVLEEKDNIVFVEYDWGEGVALAEKCMDLLPDDCDMDHWNAFVRKLDDAYEKKQNVVVSNEALSLIQGNEHTKKLFLTLTDNWDVRIIMAYRSLETWYPSMYKEDRAQTIFKKRNKQYRGYTSEQVPNPCNDSFPVWLEKHWNKVYLGDPLETLNAYEYIFGKDKVKTLMMISPDGVDISKQFVCDGLEAKHGCERVNKQRKAPRHFNVADDKRYPIYYENDLLVMGAYNRGWLKKDRLICNIELRCNHASIVQQFKQEKGIKKIEGLAQVCTSREHSDALKEKSWIAESTMSTQPMSRGAFEESFDKVAKSKHCSVDVDKVLSDPEWESFFKTDERLCLQYTRKMERLEAMKAQS